MKNKKLELKKTYLGIELGSTRIKAILVDDTYAPIASGNYEWENIMEKGYWTYSIDDIHKGVRACYKNLKADVYNKYGIQINTVGAIGISAMMHGYLALDDEKNFLVPFRTWRNTTTKEAAEELTDIFKFNIPQRWSIAHLYQAIKNNEPHVKNIKHITTLAGYIHYLLTDSFEVGIGDASGMFPINGDEYDKELLCKFHNLIGKKNYSWNIREIMPVIKKAGAHETFLTKAGAEFLDPDGDLKYGIPMCPPEGDAGTGMVATNSVLPKTGNVSAGTSIFSMLVMEKQLEKNYSQVDIVATPEGLPVSMVHCNNCCGELDAWINIFLEFASLIGKNVDKSEIYNLLYKNATNGKCNGMVSYNYLSGEHVTEITNGHPLFFRTQGSKMNLANFIKSQLYSSFSTLVLGMRMLFEKEEIESERFFAHGGLFKTPKVAQQMLANALNTPVSVMDTAGEGGAWGMALLAAYMMNNENKTLGEWLKIFVFKECDVVTLNPIDEGVKEFNDYLETYKAGIITEKILENL